MLSRLRCAFIFAALFGVLAGLSAAAAVGQRPKGPCDIYAAAGDDCVAAHSTTRALYAAYDGPLYQVLRQSDMTTLDIGVVKPSGSDPGGYADAKAQDQFCANTYCWIAKIYDQSPKHNDLAQAPRGGFSGPAMGGFNNLPIADMAPITIMGHKVYGVFIEPGMGLRIDDPRGTAVDDQAEGQYWVINGLHFNNGCCFDYGNAEIDSRDDDNGTMETAYFGNATPWFHGSGVGPWIMTDQENNLVGCVNTDATKGCPTLPSITWRFVTAMAKGEPHRWTSMGGDAQKGDLAVMFSGQRVNSTYDPMRKQGAILLGNGGDNSESSQGTFYEGAMTAAGTFPTDATDQLVQANIVAAHYDAPALTIAPASAIDKAPGLQTFSPGTSQDVAVKFTNRSDSPIQGLKLSIVAPKQWTVLLQGGKEGSKTIAEAIPPGATANATFMVKSSSTAFNGDLVASATWTNSTGKALVEHASEKLRNVNPVKINEVRIGSGSTNQTDSFIELFNAGSNSVDISNWSLTEHPSQIPASSIVKIPAGTKLASREFYVLGLSNSGLVASTRAGDKTIYVRSTEGMSVGDNVTIDTGANAETGKIASVGAAAAEVTTVFQPLPDGYITVPKGAKNVPVFSTVGFKVGEKIALGYGGTYPAVAKGLEKYEIATVTAVGKRGTQAYLIEDAAVGATNLKVTSLADISVGDKIRLDIDSKGHGIETVTVKSVGTEAKHTNLSAGAGAGATNIKVRNVGKFAVGEKITVGTPVSRETVTISAVGSGGKNGSGIDFSPALGKVHGIDELVETPGTGLELEEPLKFAHAGNLPFADRGTGISFEPATAFEHKSNEPVLALGSGITLDRPLAKAHDVDAAVRDEAVKGAGYQGTTKPHQWFGGPELTAHVPYFDRIVARREGSIVLRDAAGMVVDSLNYGALTDPWAGEGYQAVSGTDESGCHTPAPGALMSFSSSEVGNAVSTSVGRFPDGADTDSNCNDFLIQAAASLSTGAAAGTSNIKVSSVDGFEDGETVMIGSGADQEKATIATVGTAGATRVGTDTAAGANVIPVSNANGFRDGQTITIDSGENAETAEVLSIRRFGATSITVAAPLTHPHAVNAQVSGSGITLSAPLAKAHDQGTRVNSDIPTPSAPNQYHRTKK
ncbi:MAG: lamin tail domain-containing protein [Acidobacteria bacterium]|nr:lamin tail domain-containing protein [Acidobacteriota bacterium]